MAEERKKKKKINRLSDDELHRLSMEKTNQSTSKYYKAIEKQEKQRLQKKLKSLRGD